MITPADKLAAAAETVWLTLPEALQRIDELEKLSIALFVTLQSAHAATIALSDNDALNAELELRNATLEAEVTRILGKPALLALQGKGA